MSPPEPLVVLLIVSDRTSNFWNFAGVPGATLERVQQVQLHPSIFRKPHLHPSIFKTLSEKKEKLTLFDWIRAT